MNEIGQAEAAIAAMKNANSRLADTARWPFWRHAAVGLLMGFLIAMQTASSPVRIAANAAVIIGSLALVRHDRRSTGVFVNGWRMGWTLCVTVVLMAGLIAALIAVYRMEPVSPGPLMAIVIAVVVWTTALSYLWQAVYRRELGAK